MGFRNAWGSGAWFGGAKGLRPDWGWLALGLRTHGLASTPLCLSEGICILVVDGPVLLAWRRVQGSEKTSGPSQSNRHAHTLGMTLNMTEVELYHGLASSFLRSNLFNHISALHCDALVLPQQIIRLLGQCSNNSIEGMFRAPFAGTSTWRPESMSQESRKVLVGDSLLQIP